MPNIRRIALVVALLWCVAAVAAPKTDVVVLINGDTITGEIEQLDRGILRYSTDFMGTLSIEWNKVAQVKSSRFFEVEMLSGERLFGSPVWLGERGTMRLQVAGDDEGRSVMLQQTTRMAVLDRGRFVDKLDGKLSLGWSATAANDQNQLALDASIAYRDTERLVRATYEGERTDSELRSPSTRQSLTLDHSRFVGLRSFWLGRGSAAMNDELGLDLRVLAAGGFGRYLLQSSRQEASVAAGIAVSREDFSDGDTQESIEGILVGTYDLYSFDVPELDIAADLALYPSFTVSDRVRTESSISMRYKIIDDFYYELELQHSYDSKPQSEDAAKRDWSLITSFGYSF